MASTLSVPGGGGGRARGAQLRACLDADGDGVVVRNTLRATPIPWRDLAAIEFKGVESKVWAIEGDMYYKLVFQRHDGSGSPPRHPAVEQDPASTFRTPEGSRG